MRFLSFALFLLINTAVVPTLFAVAVLVIASSKYWENSMFHYVLDKLSGGVITDDLCHIYALELRILISLPRISKRRLL